MSITIGETRKYEFEGPFKIQDWKPSYNAAVYAILKKSSRDGNYNLIYIGQSENMADRGFYKSHHAYTCWLRNVNSEGELFIAIYFMPSSTENQRKEVESILIKDYNPSCNKEV